MITDPEKKVNPVVKFPFLSRPSLKEFAKQYTPDMGITELQYCQRFYLREAKRDPSLAELSFLNNIVACHASKPEAILISELSTNDRFIVDTFSDLTEKRAMLEPDYHMPCSLAGIPDVARDYLSAKRQNTKTTPLSFSCRKHHLLELTAAKTRTTLLYQNADEGLSAGEKRHSVRINHEPLMPGDRIYAILNSTDPTENAEEKLIAFASSLSVMTDVKQCLLIGSEGLLFPLIDLGHGFSLDLSRIYGENADTKKLLDADFGLILIARASASADTLIDALDAGLRPHLAGQLLADGQVSIRKDDRENYTFSISFFRSLFLSRAYRAEVKTHNVTDSTVTLCPISSVVGKEPIFVCRAKGIGESPYHTVLSAAVSAIAACVAHGGRLDKIRIAETLRLSLADTSAVNLGDLVASLLGLYRAVEEFELTDVCTDLRTVQEPELPVTLYAIISEPPCPTPDHVCTNNSGIFLLEPTYTADGLPDFEDMKKMFSYVGKLRQDGILLSARAVTGDVISALEAMDREELVEYLRHEPITAKPGSILVEARENIQGKQVAVTCRPAPLCNAEKREDNA